MNKNLQKAQHFFRKARLLPLVEYLRYRVALMKFATRNREFRRQYPAFTLPPAHLAYDAYSAPDWSFYKETGEATARDMAEAIAQYVRPTDGSPAVLEWGCGPGRVIRHLPGLLPDGTTITGTDYNDESIEWCRKNLPKIDFRLNGLEPPLPFDDESFDFVYALSVFTHLAAATAGAWRAELRRVIRPNGVLLFSNNGDHYKEYMLPTERQSYETTGYVERSHFAEGKKMFIAFHSPTYTRANLLQDFDILEHRPAGAANAAQDIWIARRSR